VTAPTGYLHPDYAASLAEFGTPRHLPESDGWIIERRITDAPDRDAMGPYPLFACRDWSKLHRDLDAISDDLVSLVLVTDPLGAFTLADLERSFPDRLIRFKDHFVADLSVPLDDFVDSHHRRNVRKALKAVSVERIEDPARLHGEWCALYQNLIERHSIRGISAFSPAAFRRQLEVPGLSMFCALQDGEVIGIALWYEQAGAGYYHLAAYSARGYELRASFALFWRAFEHFAAKGLRMLDLGAGAGTDNLAEDGLTRFKRGWSTGTLPTYLGGRIFDPPRYKRLAEAASAGTSGYFPAYRAGEFA
jgi:hypothetical protein